MMTLVAHQNDAHQNDGQPCEIGVLGPDAACRLWLLRPSKRAATLQGIGVRVSSLPGCEEGPLSTPVDPAFLALVKTIDFANIKIALVHAAVFRFCI